MLEINGELDLSYNGYTSPAPKFFYVVGVAQLVEHPVVVRDVAGSSPVAHPINTLVTALFKQLLPKPFHQLIQK